MFGIVKSRIIFFPDSPKVMHFIILLTVIELVTYSFCIGYLIINNYLMKVLLDILTSRSIKFLKFFN